MEIERCIVMCEKCGEGQGHQHGGCGGHGECGGHEHGGCGSGECGHGGAQKMPAEAMFMMFLEIADEAWSSLMKKKMMEHYEKKIGKKMDEKAEFFVDQVIMKWSDKDKWNAQLDKSFEEFKKMSEKKK
jgi:hypothetical protein